MPDLHVRIVPNGPPERRHEIRTGRAEPNHVWVGGYWHHTGQDWVWNDGGWVVRPSRHVRWIPPRYQRVRGGYRYIPGHWSNQRLIYR